MTIDKYTVLSLFAILALNGCTGSEVMPNNATQTGAVTGAVAGSVIGYNSKGHHRGQRAAIGAVAGAATGALIGNAIDENNPPPEDTSGWHE
jgi:uncharacterized protein YcfJ